MVMQPGSLSIMPCTGSSMMGARGGQTVSVSWSSMGAKTGHSSTTPSALAMAHWSMPAWRVSASQPLRKSPWKPNPLYVRMLVTFFSRRAAGEEEMHTSGVALSKHVAPTIQCDTAHAVQDLVKQVHKLDWIPRRACAIVNDGHVGHMAVIW